MWTSAGRSSSQAIAAGGSPPATSATMKANAAATRENPIVENHSDDTTNVPEQPPAISAATVAPISKPPPLGITRPSCAQTAHHAPAARMSARQGVNMSAAWSLGSWTHHRHSGESTSNAAMTTLSARAEESATMSGQAR